MTLGEIIRARRKALDLTQAELADRSGLSQMSVSLFENGRRNPSLGTLDVLAVHLKCSPKSGHRRYQHKQCKQNDLYARSIAGHKNAEDPSQIYAKQRVTPETVGFQADYRA